MLSPYLGKEFCSEEKKICRHSTLPTTKELFYISLLYYFWLLTPLHPEKFLLCICISHGPSEKKKSSLSNEMHCLQGKIKCLLLVIDNLSAGCSSVMTLQVLACPLKRGDCFHSFLFACLVAFWNIMWSIQNS